jgi:RND family efflux transporter MFP subunit
VSEGDVVNPGTLLFTVIDPATMRLEASVPVEDYSAIRTGTPVEFRVAGLEGQRFTGKVTRVSPVVDPATRQVRIVASIPNTGNRLLAGLFAEGRVATSTREGIVVPMVAVDDQGVRPLVRRVKGGRVERVEVTLGLRDRATERVEVTSGVAAGDSLLLGAAAGIAAGTPVTIRRLAEQPAARPAADTVAE